MNWTAALSREASASPPGTPCTLSLAMRNWPSLVNTGCLDAPDQPCPWTAPCPTGPRLPRQAGIGAAVRRHWASSDTAMVLLASGLIPLTVVARKRVQAHVDLRHKLGGNLGPQAVLAPTTGYRSGMVRGWWPSQLILPPYISGHRGSGVRHPLRAGERERRRRLSVMGGEGKTQS
jgi:hypothetical protein